MAKLKVIICLLSFVSLVSIVWGNCFEDPYSSPNLSQKAQNEVGACDWYNGKNACPSCRGLTSQNISLQQYQTLHGGSVEFECGAPPRDCHDYLLQFLCGIHCSPLLIQMVPEDEESSANSSSSSVSSSSLSSSETDEPQTTVCQYFADRMWEKCHDWKVKDTLTGECVSLRKIFGNAMGYYDSISGGVVIWAPTVSTHNKITNCFNSAFLLSPSFTVLMATLLLLVCTLM